jgi:hypothetical protein
MSFKIRSRRDAACFIDCFEAFAQPYPLGDPAFYKFIFRNLNNDSEVSLNKYGKNDFRFKNSKMSQEETQVWRNNLPVQAAQGFPPASKTV